MTVNPIPYNSFPNPYAPHPTTGQLGHCHGCRCFQNTWTTTWTAPLYVPKHRKPGPAK